MNNKTNHVRYNKELNNVEGGQLSAVAQNLFFYICSRVREHKDEVVNISFDSIVANTGFTASGDKALVEKLLDMNRTLLDLNYEYVAADGIIIQGGIFSTFITNAVEKTLSIRVNKDLLFLLNDLDANFTDWELAEFVHIRSVYSKRLYRLVKEWNRNKETPYFAIEDIRNKMGVSENCENKKFMSKIFVPACEEMKNYFPEFSFEVFRKPEKGAPISAICFSF